MQQNDKQPIESQLVGTILINLIKTLLRYFDTLYLMTMVYMAISVVNQLLQIVTQIKINN